MSEAQSETEQRRLDFLRHAFGKIILKALDDPDVNDIEVNHRGDIHLGTVSGKDQAAVGHIDATEAEAIIRLVANAVGAIAGPDNPMVAGQLPVTGERFQGWLPPLVHRPSFVIRKPARTVFSLESYVQKNIMSDEQASLIRDSVARNKNIIIAGGMGSGKTTLLDAILDLSHFKKYGLYIIEDQAEIHCLAPNFLAVQTKPSQPTVTMRDLVKVGLRSNKDKFIIGEVRDGSALDLIRAWGTGHPGGLGTLHANSAYEALLRVEDLISEVAINIPRWQISKAINVIVYIEKTPFGRKVLEIVEVLGLKDDGVTYETRRVAAD